MKKMYIFFLVALATVSNVWTADDLSRRLKEVSFESAIESNQFDKFKILLEEVDVNARRRLENTPLMVAAYQDHDNALKMTEMLLDRDAPVNAQDKYGNTALMWAVRRERERGGPDRRIIKLLLDRGADKALTDNEGKTAAAIARERGYDDLAKFIDEYVPDTGLTKGAADR